jgi:hypothetical protein
MKIYEVSPTGSKGYQVTETIFGGSKCTVIFDCSTYREAETFARARRADQKSLHDASYDKDS